MSLNPTNPSLAKAILITHLIIAQDEVNKLMGSSLSSSNKLNLVNKIDPNDKLSSTNTSNGAYTAVLDNDTIVITNNKTGEENRIKKTLKFGNLSLMNFSMPWIY